MRLNGERTVPQKAWLLFSSLLLVWLWQLIFTSLYFHLPIVRQGMMKMMDFTQNVEIF